MRRLTALGPIDAGLEPPQGITTSDLQHRVCFLLTPTFACGDGYHLRYSQKDHKLPRLLPHVNIQH